MINRNPSKISTNLEETEDEHSFPPWPDLPSPAVEKIYSFLNRTDQKNMSLVCHNWREEYSSSSLWRKMTFRISEIKNNKKLGSFLLSRFLAAFFRCACKTENYRVLCPEVVYAKRFGAMFRQVEILFPTPPWLVTCPLPSIPHAVLDQLVLFLKVVTRRSQLQSISFKYMYFSFREADEAKLYSRVYRRILDLLKSQKKLRYVEFNYSRFKEAEAAKILKVILANNPKTLRRLLLPAFAEEQNHDQLEDIAVGAKLNYVTLMNLEVLAMDYTQMFENMILSFYENRNKVDIRERKGRLRKIMLWCNGYNAVNYLGIEPFVWDYLRNIFPRLRIVLMLFSPSVSSFSKYIVPGMPIRTLFFKSSFVDEQTKKIGPLLRHMMLCSIHKSIEEFRVILKGASSNLAQDLIILTNVCPKLKVLDLVADDPVIADLETVFGRWLEKRPASLRAVKITVRFVLTEEMKNNYSSLIDSYASVLQPLKLILSCVSGT